MSENCPYWFFVHSVHLTPAAACGLPIASRHSICPSKSSYLSKSEKSPHKNKTFWNENDPHFLIYILLYRKGCHDFAFFILHVAMNRQQRVALTKFIDISWIEEKLQQKGNDVPLIIEESRSFKKDFKVCLAPRLILYIMEDLLISIDIKHVGRWYKMAIENQNISTY